MRSLPHCEQVDWGIYLMRFIRVPPQLLHPAKRLNLRGLEPCSCLIRVAFRESFDLRRHAVPSEKNISDEYPAFVLGESTHLKYRSIPPMIPRVIRLDRGFILVRHLNISELACSHGSFPSDGIVEAFKQIQLLTEGLKGIVLLSG